MSDDFEIGSIIKGKKGHYKLIKEIGGGAQLSFKAQSIKGGEDVFLKIYFNGPKKNGKNKFDVFLEQQRAVYSRLNELEDITETLYEDFLIDDLYYCAVKQFVVGQNVEELILNDMDKLTETQLLGLAVVFIGVLKAIHLKGVTHTDLKPQQLYVIQNTSIGIGWELTIRDFDSAHVEGITPFGVIGTQFYFSPEHLKGNTIITRESDIFTAGIILGEILTGGIGAVYDVGEEDDGTVYNERVSDYEVNPVILNAIDSMYKDGAQISQCIKKMLNPNPAKRPEIDNIHKILIKALKAQKEENTDLSESIPVIENVTVEDIGVVTPYPPKPENKIPAIIEFEFNENKITAYSEKMFGRNNFRIFGRDNYQYSSENQFLLKKNTEGWGISNIDGVINKTILNGEVLDGKEIILKADDIVQIGTLKLKVSFK